MSQRYYGTLDMGSEADPCSLLYQTSNAQHAPSLNPSKSTKRRVRKSYLSTVRKGRMGLFRSIKKFLTFKSKKGTFKTPYEFRASMQASMRSLQSATEMTAHPATEINGQVAQATRPKSYRIHSFIGAGSPPSAAASTVRFSHPVVISQLSIPRPTTTESAMLENDTEVNFEPNNHDSVTSNLSVPETVEFPGDISEKPGSLCPKSMWRWTSQSATARGARETYDEFKSRLDGHTRRSGASRSSERAPSLQFLARLPTIKFNFEDDEDQSSAPANNKDQINNHRSQALNALEGGVASQTVRFTDTHLPTSLIPGGIRQGAKGDLSTGYKPYRSSDVSHLIVPDTVPTFTRKMKNKKQPVDLISPFDEEFNKRHSQNYSDVESGVFNEFVIAQATGGASMDGEVDGRSFLLPPTPPKTPQMSSITGKAIKRKPVSTPPINTPSTLEFIKMVDNGYPLLERGIQQRFSSAPTYQPRFVNDVEAKFAKAEKVKQLKKLRSETKKTYSMQKRDFLTEQGRKKMEELDRLDEQLRRLMCI